MGISWQEDTLVTHRQPENVGRGFSSNSTQVQERLFAKVIKNITCTIIKFHLHFFVCHTLPCARSCLLPQSSMTCQQSPRPPPRLPPHGDDWGWRWFVLMSRPTSLIIIYTPPFSGNALSGGAVTSCQLQTGVCAKGTVAGSPLWKFIVS